MRSLHPAIKSIKFTVAPTDAPLRIFDPIREADIAASLQRCRLVVCMVEAGDYKPRFMIHECKRFSSRAVWTRYVRAVESRTERRYASVSGGLNMREWLENLIDPELRQDKPSNTSDSELIPLYKRI